MVLSGNISQILSQVNISNPLIISLYGDQTEKAVAILKAHPYVKTITIRGADIAVRFSGDDEDQAILLQQLVDADVPVKSFSREKGSLESLFMEITDDSQERTVLKFETESNL